jgi:hypothetical protein
VRLYYYRARYYDSTTARFLNEDLLRFRSDSPSNLYRYGANSPLKYKDPLGTCIIELYVVPTGQQNDGHLYHSFLVLYDNSKHSGANPARVFRGGPALGTPPLLEAGFGPLMAGGPEALRTPDQPSESVFSTALLENECGCQEYLDRLNKLVAQIDSLQIAYTPRHSSNTVTSTAIDVLGLSAPKIPIDVRWRLWGWGNSLIPNNGGGW